MAGSPCHSGAQAGRSSRLPAGWARAGWNASRTGPPSTVKRKREATQKKTARTRSAPSVIEELAASAAAHQHRRRGDRGSRLAAGPAHAELQVVRVDALEVHRVVDGIDAGVGAQVTGQDVTEVHV